MIVVLHSIGDEAGAAPWRDAFASQTDEAVFVPDLPGHGGAAPPVGGNYTRVDPAYTVARAVVAGDVDLTDAVLIGVGASAWSALVIAMAGQGSGLVLVDGLGTPWIDQADWAARRRSLLRRLADDPDAQAAVATGYDPRLRHGIAPHGDEALVLRAAGHVEVPMLLTGSLPDAAARVAAHVPGGAQVTAAVEPHDVAAATLAWLATWR